MALTPVELENHINQLLTPAEFSDYCPNGLQVDTRQPISKLVTGVTASLELIQKAAIAGADAILVHHGYFWRGEDPKLVGMKGARIQALFNNNLSLFAYHLPLDAHPTLGNNANLAKLLNLKITGPLFAHEKHPVGVIAKPLKPITTHQFAASVEHALQRKPLHVLGGPDRNLTQIGLCSGGAQDFIDQASLMGCQLYLSGEVSERTVLSAREMGIDYLAAGHHATERGGAQQLGLKLASDLGLEVEFIDIDNPA